MPIFETSFVVKAPLQAVADFHSSTAALRRLSPPPVWVRLHEVEPLAEGSKAVFSMVFGVFPVRWVAVHSNVDPRHGFTDTQMEGPLSSWKHTHRFEALDEQTTHISERIEYQHHKGLKAAWTRLFFSGIGLRFLFLYRAWATRWATRKHRN